MEFLIVLLSLISLINAAEEIDPTGGVSEENRLKVLDTYKIPNCGMKTKIGDKIFWKYYGKLATGQFFDSGTFSATLGAGHVIKGVDEGMKDLCVGDKRTMTIHSSWGYGTRGTGNIPGNATLVFDVELLSLERPGVATETIESKLNRTGGVSKENKLKIVDVFPTGKCKIKVKEGDIVTMEFYGYFLDGKRFDSGDYDGTVGKDEFIIGVDKGIRGLCVGDKRSLTIHPDWAFGEEGTNNVPPNATIIFDIKILDTARAVTSKKSKGARIDPLTGLKTDQKLKIEMVHEVENCTMRTATDDTIFWKYRGTFLDGTEFHKGLFQATLGHGHVITGVDKGMRKMCVGEKRRLTIHSDWAYGNEGRPGSIPPRATLIFDVELTKIERPNSRSEL